MRVRSVPLTPCRRHGKKRKDDDAETANNKKDKHQDKVTEQKCQNESSRNGIRRDQQLTLDMVPMFDSIDAQLQSSQVSSTVLDSPVYQGWGYQNDQQWNRNGWLEQRKNGWLNWPDCAYGPLDRDGRVDPDSTSLDESRPRSCASQEDQHSRSRAHSVSPRSSMSGSSRMYPMSPGYESCYSLPSPVPNQHQLENRSTPSNPSSPRTNYYHQYPNQNQNFNNNQPMNKGIHPQQLQQQQYSPVYHQNGNQRYQKQQPYSNETYNQAKYFDNNNQNWNWGSEHNPSIRSPGEPSPFRVPQGRPPSRTAPQNCLDPVFQGTFPKTFLKPQEPNKTSAFDSNGMKNSYSVNQQRIMDDGVKIKQEHSSYQQQYPGYPGYPNCANTTDNYGYNYPQNQEYHSNLYPQTQKRDSAPVPYPYQETPATFQTMNSSWPQWETYNQIAPPTLVPGSGRFQTFIKFDVYFEVILS